MQVYGPINNVMGEFACVGAKPPAGSTKATITVNMPANELTDTTNYLRLRCRAAWDDGLGYRNVLANQGGEDWHGGPGQTAPTFVWSWNAGHPPTLVQAIVENGINDAGSPAKINSVTITFA